MKFKYVYYLYLFMPKHRSKWFIYEGRYLPPLVFQNRLDARVYAKKWRHAWFIKKVKLR